MYARRQARLPRVTNAWVSVHAPGMHDGFFATERELRDIKTGAVIGPNGGPAAILTPAPAETAQASKRSMRHKPVTAAPSRMATMNCSNSI